MIKLQSLKCLHSLSQESECNRCEIICPTDAITIGSNPLPSIDISLCVACGACNAVCPNEAFYLDSFVVEDFFYKFIDEQNAGFVSCRKNVPCIAALSVDHLVSMAILKGRIILDTGHCNSCEIAHKCYKEIVKNYEESTYILEAMLSDAEIKLKNVAYEQVEDVHKQKRELLSALKPLKNKTPFENDVERLCDELFSLSSKSEDISLLKQKLLPKKRQILFGALKKLKRPSVYHVIDAQEITLTTQKYIDKNICNACKKCYQLCPCGALSSDILNSKIDFNPFLCINCDLCENVCESDCIDSLPSYSLASFFEPTLQNLITFNLFECEKCGMKFATNSQERVCSRCSGV